LRIKNVGHINSDSHLGLWQEGLMQLHQLVRKVKAKGHHKNIAA